MIYVNVLSTCDAGSKVKVHMSSINNGTLFLSCHSSSCMSQSNVHFSVLHICFLSFLLYKAHSCTFLSPHSQSTRALGVFFFSSLPRARFSLSPFTLKLLLLKIMNLLTTGTAIRLFALQI